MFSQQHWMMSIDYLERDVGEDWGLQFPKQIINWAIMSLKLWLGTNWGIFKRIDICWNFCCLVFLIEFCSCYVEWCKVFVCQSYRDNWKQLICGKVSIFNVLQRDSGKKGEYWLSVFICLLTDCAHHKCSDGTTVSLYPAVFFLLIPYSYSNDCECS